MTLEQDLKDLADEVHPLNPLAATRLESLSLAVSPNGDPGGWPGVDPLRAIDPAETVATLRTRPLVSNRLAGLEHWRNFLALVPVFLTWVGLTYAAAGYHAAVTADPALIERPFLLLWEEGFQGHARFPFSLFNFMTLSHVAILDIGVLLAMLVLTWLIHRDINVNQAKREAQARALEQRLQQALWRAALALAQRSSVAAGIDRFQQAAEGLLDELRAERERIGRLAEEREREGANLRSFASGLKRGATDLLRYSGEVKSTYDTLLRVSEAVGRQVGDMAQSQARLEAALGAVADELVHHHQAYRAAAGQLDMSTRQLGEAAEQSVAATAGVGDAVAQIRAELLDLRQQFVAERSAYQSAAATAERSGNVLAQALQSTVTAAQGLEQSAAAMQALLGQLSAVPHHLSDAAREQVAAASVTSTAAGRIATAMNGTDARLNATADALIRSAGTIDGIAPAIRAVTDASAALARQAQVVIQSAPTHDTLVAAWREATRDALREVLQEMQREQADRYARGGNGAVREVGLNSAARRPWWRRLFSR